MRLNLSTILGSVTAFLVLLVGASFAIPACNRYQRVLDAHNEIEVNRLVAIQTKQRIQTETQKALIRIEEAKGIAQAQKLINATLTDQYLQHEAIEAQRSMAGSQNHTQIYIPVGNNGIPLVKTVDAPQVPVKSE